MTIYRYRLYDPALRKIANEVPGPLTFEALPGNLRLLIDAPPSSKPDLDESMRRYGYVEDTSLPVQPLVTASLVPLLAAVPSAFAVLGGTVAWPSSYVTNPAQLLIRVVGAYTSDGDIQVRLLEDGAFIGGATLPAIGGETSFSFDCPVAVKPARSIYTFEAQLAGALVATVGYVTAGVVLLPAPITP